MIRIEIETGNDAFAGPMKRDIEVARILRRLADEIQNEALLPKGAEMKLFDINGNSCGLATHQPVTVKDKPMMFPPPIFKTMF